VPATLGQRQVDRAAAGIAVDARVAAALEHLHAPPALRQQRGQQRPGQAGADDGDPLSFAHALPFLQSSTARAKRRTSEKVLYRGTGEIRITSGSRPPPTIPRPARYSNSARPRPRPP